MYHQPILDLAEFEPVPRGGMTRPAVSVLRRPKIVIVALAAVVGFLALAAANLAPTAPPAPSQTVRVALPDQQAIAQMSVDDKSQIVVEGSDAERRNALIPILTQPVEQARRFLLAQTATGEPRNALRCLTQAVYYEAAYEPLEGRRAVAQVVLNRMRHPAYPKSVCGVVYQGSERVTGCQFSFTCDGALLRTPAAGPWREAEAVARAALAGYVEPSVGTATHYHADYVLPKWAFQLGKIAQLGRHIFYRFPGGWGRPAAFSGQYSGIERIPALNYLALRERAEMDGTMPATTFENGLTVPPAVTDRHAPADVGGRLDVTKAWRLSIPDPTAGTSRYRDTVDATSHQASPGLGSATIETSASEAAAS